MTEHRPGSEQPLSELVDIRDCVTVPAIPTVYGLHPSQGRRDGLGLRPARRASLHRAQPRGRSQRDHTSLDLVQRRWGRVKNAQLGLVTAT